MSPSTINANPQRILEHTFGFVSTHALSCAVELDLFNHIQQGATTLEKLTERSGTSARGLRSLLGALCALGYLATVDGHLQLAPDAATFLVPNSPAYLGGLVRHHQGQGGRWESLTEVVRTGRTSQVAVESDEDDGKFFASFVDALFGLNFPAAQAVAAQLGGSPRDAVDIGAGSAVWSLALAQAHPDLKVVAVDRQEVLDRVSSLFTGRLGATERYTFEAGNFRRLDLGQERFDVAYLGHILHSEGAARSAVLLKRLNEALRPQGKLVIAEMVADFESPQETLMPHLFGLNMLMNTEEGEVFSAPQLVDMCQQAGFARTEWVKAPSPSPILIAHKR